MIELFDHTADLGLRVQAATLSELFAEAGRGLFQIIVAQLDTVRAEEQKSFALEAESLEYLLFDWLSELLYAFDAQRMLFCRFEVEVEGCRLSAQAWGEPYDPARHPLAHEVKAITYHGLRLQQSPEGYLAEVIVDI